MVFFFFVFCLALVCGEIIEYFKLLIWVFYHWLINSANRKYSLTCYWKPLKVRNCYSWSNLVIRVFSPSCFDRWRLHSTTKIKNIILLVMKNHAENKERFKMNLKKQVFTLTPLSVELCNILLKGMINHRILKTILNGIWFIKTQLAQSFCGKFPFNFCVET